MTKVCIIIPCINLWERYTKECVHSVQNAILELLCQDGDYEVITLLIDNASEDNTEESGKHLQSDSFFYKRNDEPMSFSESVNYGVNFAWEKECNYAFVINNDTIIHQESIIQLLKRFKKGDCGMVTCYDISRGQYSDAKSLYTIKASYMSKVEEAEHPNFSAFMIDKKTWDKVGEFDINFKPAYFEDNDYHRRMQLKGIKAIVYPKALFHHYASKTWSEGLAVSASIKRRLFENNKQYYINKWGGIPGEETFTKPFNK